jgi:hypothetical protein
MVDWSKKANIRITLGWDSHKKGVITGMRAFISQNEWVHKSIFTPLLDEVYLLTPFVFRH